MAIAHDSQNNVFVTGRALITGRGTDIIVLKLSAAAGAVLWNETFGGSALADDIAWDVAVGNDDNPVVTGFLVQAGNEAHHLTRKLDNATGDTVWQRLENGALNNVEVRSAWLALADGQDVIMAQRSFGPNGYDVVLKRYADTDGSTVWDTRYDGPTSGGDDVRALTLDGDGNILIAGVQDASWNYNYMALKFDVASGDLIWEAGYDGPVGWYDVANCIAEGPDGTVIVSGLSDGSGTGWDWATVAFSAEDGSQIWAERYDGPASQSDEARDIVCTPAGDIFVTGYGYGEGTNKDLVTIRYQVATASPAGDIPGAVIATRAWPNPFNPRINLSFELPREARTRIEIFDLRGKRITTLRNEVLGSGLHQITWDGRDAAGRPVAGGAYLVQVRSGDLVNSRKIVLAK